MYRNETITLVFEYFGIAEYEKGYRLTKKLAEIYSEDSEVILHHLNALVLTKRFEEVLIFTEPLESNINFENDRSFWFYIVLSMIHLLKSDEKIIEYYQRARSKLHPNDYEWLLSEVESWKKW